MREFYAGNGPRLMLDEGSIFDVGACIVDGVDLAPGKAVPDDGDPRISHSVEGFLFTCGPDHIRHPEPNEGGKPERFPLHGSFSASPANVTRFEIDEGTSTAEATVDVALVNGGRARLMRRWRIDGTGTVFLEDVLENTGSAAFAPMWMYHMNLGAKHFDDDVKLSGKMFDPPAMDWTFGPGDGHVFCVPVGKGKAEVQLGPLGAIGGKTLSVSFESEALPYLQMWRNQEAPAHVLGIEPVSHDWKPRAELNDAGQMPLLKPGQTKSYGLSFRFS